MLRSPAHLIGHGPGAGGGGVVGLHSHASSPPHARPSLFDSCHRKIRLIGGGPVAFLGGLVAKARRKERDGDSNQGDTKLYLEESLLERKLPDADLRLLVDLPAGLDYNEWLASHTLALFEHVNLVYGTISEFCTTSGCPDMTGPGTRMYLWFDEKGKKTRVAAPQYIDYVMTFTQKTVSDESIFPTKYANEFPSSFESIARKIVRLLFHVIAHLYAAHFREVVLLGLHAHLNLTFSHLTAFHRRFNLIEPKETEVLRDLEIALRLTDDPTAPVTAATDSSASIASTTSASTGTTNTCSSSSTSSTASCSPPLLLTSTTTTTTVPPNNNGAVNSGCPSQLPSSTTCSADNNNSSSSDNTTTSSTVLNHALIDGDATAQPICKQPLESGSVVVNSNSHNHHPHPHHHHHHHQHKVESCATGGGGGGGSGSSTGSVGVTGCGVGYSVGGGGGGGGGGGHSGGGPSSQQSSNTQTTA
ncbi:MOB kinase activator-like 2 isoform X2 [Anopheles stephensi]|uniref:MOB kinase activator-like 2 isoform X2 n=1 Tax=Anopheles stephensi TaxID=30069 RepID=UPI00165873C3|nr:MOB kinase activator-like 2 isoform X2 [Anopheles stephensi]XP_035892949.1 MOB kinase activator-like 2 isoform X2 [Anopheles stephensi]XP_035892950.1 MOB kinase activator-like 2 isoform X2 [Anopheles stephensi]XP_035892951.1 MOB kinase activator-like 2 isoform X2 [Anopheles stephensi]XP_035892952.1 MOB kinase activator-like 2 isoform X2 [Anopheles stephensi]XP_035892953.1 MOB kinase activator-like 2 isoform X2 [Anopheles stephensi]